MRKLYGKKLSMVLATTLTVANVGALMPMTAFAATDDITSYDWSGTAKTAEKIYTGQNITLKLDWGEDLDDDDVVKVYANKAVKVGNNEPTAAGTAITSMTGLSDGDQTGIEELVITPTTTGAITFTAKLTPKEGEETVVGTALTTAEVKEAKVTGLTVSAKPAEIKAGTNGTVTVTGTETFDFKDVASDISWKVYSAEDTEYAHALSLSEGFTYTDPDVRNELASDATSLKEEFDMAVGDTVEAGDYVIRATAGEGFAKNIKLSVINPPEVIVTDGKYNGSVSGKRSVGETMQLYAFVDKSKVGASDVTWKSSDDKIATVEKGLVTAKAEGSATITATYKVTDTITESATFGFTVGPVDFVLVSDADSDTIEVGETTQLTATYGTTDVTKKVTYSSDDTSVATVNSSGVVTGIGAGEARITALYGNNYKETIDITVIAPAVVEDDYAIESESGDDAIVVGKGLQLKLTFGGKDTGEKVSWSSSAEAKATVDSKGLVTGVEAGESQITATFVVNGKTLTRTKTVTVEDAAWALTDSDESDYTITSYETDASLTEGQKLTFYPTFGGDPVVGTWSVASTTYVKVSNGVITAKKKTEGPQAVTFKADLNGDKDTEDANETLTINVTVEEATFELTSDEVEVEVGNGLQLIAKYGVEDVTNDSYITYKSSKESVAKVDAKGLVTGINEGAATITATYKINGVEKEDTYDVVVIALTSETTEANAAAKAANDAAKKATDAANEAASAADAATKAAEAAKTTPNKDTVAAARTAIDKATKAAEAAKAAAKEARELAEKAAEAADNASGQAANDAAKAAEAADTAAKVAEDAVTKADTAVSAAKATTDEAEKASKQDGSEVGKPAAEGSELKDAATGDSTGYVVTNATSGKAEVEYKGSDADRKSGKVTIPEKVRDASGNEYAVTAIADNAFKGADTKEIVVPKTVVKIGKKAFYNSKAKKITIKTNKKGKIKIGAGAFKKLPKKSKIIVKGAKGKAKTNLIQKIVKQTNSKRTTVK